MNVLVNGIGNIGTTLLHLLVKYKGELGIAKIYANKNTLRPWNEVDLAPLRESGIILCTPKNMSGFELFDEVLPQVHYIFDTGTNGSGNRTKNRYDEVKNLVGCSAQGSEKGFGVSFMSGINDAVIAGRKFVHIVSCNTHGTAALLHAIAGERLAGLDEADVVVVRRSEDIGNHERLVSANVVARHLDKTIGTHHAIDVCDLYGTLDIRCKLTSSDVTTPSQLMHAVRFNIRLKDEISQEQLENRIASSAYLSVTQKFDSNVIFESGRRYGVNGRIFSHAIVVANNLLVDGKTVKGWAFVPQEGNSLLSTIHAFLLQTDQRNVAQRMLRLKQDLLRPEW